MASLLFQRLEISCTEFLESILVLQAILHNTTRKGRFATLMSSTQLENVRIIRLLDDLRVNAAQIALLEDMDSEFAHMVAASKVSMLKPCEFEIWRMRIEQYTQMIDYILWEVIEYGNSAPKTTVVEGVEKIIPPTTAEEKA
ncbi:hypothetical protein Tco_0281230 [Tanacetum coccineum]